MPEDVTDTLKTLTPTSPDRDVLLFAAGRASAKPSPVWKAACGLLATTQVVTLGLWFARPSGPLAASPLPPPAEVIDPPSVVPVEPYSYFALVRQDDFDRVTPPSVLPPANPTKPLTAGAWRDVPQ
jgi:hypothetical protein